MKESKTAREWFLQAKAEGHEWADEALREHGKMPPCDKRKRFHSLRNALFGAFTWRRTSAGYDFWEKIHEELP